MLARSGPTPAVTEQQVVELERSVRRDAEHVERHVDVGFLRPKRIERISTGRDVPAAPISTSCSTLPHQPIRSVAMSQSHAQTLAPSSASRSRASLSRNASRTRFFSVTSRTMQR